MSLGAKSVAYPLLFLDSLHAKAVFSPTLVIHILTALFDRKNLSTLKKKSRRVRPSRRHWVTYVLLNPSLAQSS